MIFISSLFLIIISNKQLDNIICILSFDFNVFFFFNFLSDEFVLVYSLLLLLLFSDSLLLVSILFKLLLELSILNPNELNVSCLFISLFILLSIFSSFFVPLESIVGFFFMLFSSLLLSELISSSSSFISPDNFGIGSILVILL